MSVNQIDVNAINELSRQGKGTLSKIKVGDYEFFKTYLTLFGVEQSTEPQGVAALYGVPIEVDKYVPKDRAVLLDGNGNVMKIMKLKKWLNRKEKAAQQQKATV